MPRLKRKHKKKNWDNLGPIVDTFLSAIKIPPKSKIGKRREQ